MAINWNDYRNANRQRWAELLRTLMNDAKAAIEANDDPLRQATYDDLDQYIQRSPNSFSRQLDQLARATLDDIFKSATADVLQSLASRTGELTSYIKDVQAITEEANANASFLGLGFVSEAIDSATNAIGSLKRLRDSVQADGEAAAKLGADIERAIKAIQKVRTAIEDVPPAVRDGMG
jgi:hypothetical protein